MPSHVSVLLNLGRPEDKANITYSYMAVIDKLHAKLLKFVDNVMFLSTDKCRGNYYGGCPITRMCNSSASGVTCGECFPGYVTNPNSPTGDCLRK